MVPEFEIIRNRVEKYIKGVVLTYGEEIFHALSLGYNGAIRFRLPGKGTAG
jgi:hypothetical protein